MENPVLVEMYRNGIAETCHRGSAVVMSASGDIVYQVGDIERSIYPRSSLKFFQAIPLVESGAAAAFALSGEHIALACASHNAEPIHTQTVLSWLGTIGLSETALENGADYPMLQAERNKLLRANTAPTKIHHNCSGKHAGMLTVASHLNMETTGYSEHTHACQRLWMQALSELADIDVETLDWARDGCGMPAICMPIQALAQACARSALTDQLKSTRRNTMQTILKAVAAHPQMIAGRGRCCSDVISATDGEVLVKTGADGVYIAMIKKSGLGLALKIDDGSRRATEVALGALLLKISAINRATHQSLARHFNPSVINSQGHKTGEWKAGAGLSL